MLRRSPTQPEETPPVVSGASRVSEQINRLQQRQLEMVQQTALELESLKLHLENNDQFETLQRELQQLKAERGSMEHYIQDLQTQMVSQQETATQTIESLSEALRFQLQQVKNFTNQTEAYLEQLPKGGTLKPLPILELPKLAPLPSPAPVVVKKPEPPKKIVTPVEPLPAPVRELPVKKVKKVRTFSRKKIAVRTVSVALGITLLYVGFTTVKNHVGASTGDTGQVAGVATIAPTSSPDEYAASFADLPFSQTTWSTTSSIDFGISFDYPKNTSNLVTTIGGDNIWILRHNGYLMKITMNETTNDLTTWWKANQTNFNTNVKPAVTTTFKGQPALYVESKDKTPTSGSSYFVKRTNGILQIWIKDEAAATNDGQRLTHMVDTFTFTN